MKRISANNSAGGDMIPPTLVETAVRQLSKPIVYLVTLSTTLLNVHSFLTC